MGDKLWRALESDEETRKRLQRETRDAAQATARATARQAESLERLENLQRDQLGEMQEQERQRQRDAELARLDEEADREREQDRPRREALQRRLVTRLARASGLEDPFTPGRLRPDSQGFSLELHGWQEFGKWYEGLVSQMKLYESISLTTIKAAILQGLEASKLEKEWHRGVDRYGVWFHCWGRLNGIPTESVNPDVIETWVANLERVATEDLAEDHLAEPMLRAALAEVNPLRESAKAARSALSEAEARFTPVKTGLLRVGSGVRWFASIALGITGVPVFVMTVANRAWNGALIAALLCLPLALMVTGALRRRSKRAT